MSTPKDYFMAGFRHAEKIHEIKNSLADQIEAMIEYAPPLPFQMSCPMDIDKFTKKYAKEINAIAEQEFIDTLNKEQAENDLRWEQSEEDE